MVQVRESSRFGFCYALGELIGETPTLVLLGGGWQSPPPPLAAKHLSVHATLLKNSRSRRSLPAPPRKRGRARELIQALVLAVARITLPQRIREYHLPQFLEPIACTRSTIRRRTSASSICAND